MPIDIATHPQYGTHVAKYNADKTAATQAGDETAIARAETDWSNRRMEMSNDLYARQETELTRQKRISEIKAAHPAVPDDVLAGITDLDQAERIAASFQNIASQSQSGTWSPPPGGGQTAPAEVRPEDMTPEQREEARIKRMNELGPEVMAKGAMARGANEELQRLALEPVTSRFRTS